MQTSKIRRFSLATTAQLRSPTYRAHLKLAAANCGVSDRDFATLVQDMLLHVDMQDGEIWTSPERVDIPLIDLEWGDARYLRRFLASEVCENPNKDRWIDLYFRVMHPDIARHFGR